MRNELLLQEGFDVVKLEERFEMIQLAAVASAVSVALDTSLSTSLVDTPMVMY